LVLGEDSIANYLSTNCCRFYLFALSTTTVIILYVCLTAGASPSAAGRGSNTFAFLGERMLGFSCRSWMDGSEQLCRCEWWWVVNGWCTAMLCLLVIDAVLVNLDGAPVQRCW